MSNLGFDAKASGYNAKIAHRLGVSASLAYSPEAEILREVERWGMTAFKLFDANGTQAFLATDDEAIVVAFRGTEGREFEDLMTDLHAGLVGGPGGRVHEGFLLALNAVWVDLYESILEQREAARGRNEKQALWFTGHGLGAAMATLAVAKLRLERDHPVNGLYTFGQPRTGDAEFARHFDADFGGRTHRVVHSNDIVPRVPARAMKYSHVGRLAYFDENHDYREDIKWWEKLLDSIDGRRKNLFDPGTDGMKDHRMLEYMVCLERDLKRRQAKSAE